MASGQIPPGAKPVELAVDPHVMLAELRARGCQVSATVEPADRIPNPG